MMMMNNDNNDDNDDDNYHFEDPGMLGIGSFFFYLIDIYKNEFLMVWRASE